MNRRALTLLCRPRSRDIIFNLSLFLFFLFRDATANMPRGVTFAKRSVACIRTKFSNHVRIRDIASGDAVAKMKKT